MHKERYVFICSSAEEAEQWCVAIGERCTGCDDDEQGGGHGTAGAAGAAGAPRLPPLPPELRRRWRHWTCADGGARRCGACLGALCLDSNSPAALEPLAYFLE